MKILKYVLIIVGLFIGVPLVINWYNSTYQYEGVYTGKRYKEQTVGAALQELSHMPVEELIKLSDEYDAQLERELEVILEQELSKYKRPTEMEIMQMLKDGNFDEASRWLTIDEIFARTILLGIVDNALNDHVKEDEEGSSDAEYYSKLEAIRNDKSLITDQPNGVVFCYPNEHEPIKFRLPIKPTEGFPQVTYNLYIDSDGKVSNADLIEAIDCTPEFKKACLSAALNIIFEPNTPNRIIVSYEYYPIILETTEPIP